MIATMIISGTGWRIYNFHHHPKSIHEILKPIPEGEAIISANTIEVGLVADNVYNFEGDKKTFDADGWVWLKWSPEVEKKMEERAMTAQDLFFFFNGVDDYDFALIADTSAPLRRADGRFYQQYRFSGHFYANDLNFRLYPFQTIKLPLAFELKSIPLLGENSPLRLTLDQEHSGVGSYIDLGGYITKGFSFSNFIHQYRSSHDEPGLADGTRRLYQARMEIFYEKEPMATVIKLILPLVAVMALTLVSPSIPPIGWDIRLGVPPTSMLTLIFLQQSYQAWIPELPYVTFLDSVYNICYLVNMFLFGLYLWGSLVYHFAAEEDRSKVIVRITQVDFFSQVFLLVFSPVGIAIDWYSMGLHWN